MTASDSNNPSGHGSDGVEESQQPEAHDLTGPTAELSLRVPESWADALDEEAIRQSVPGDVSDRSKITRELLVEHLGVDEESGEVFLER